MKEKLENKNKIQNGITLIALIVTIIILLILATVTLTVTIGEDGLISSAKFASFSSKILNYDEQAKIYAMNEQLTNKVDNVEVLNKEKLKEIIVGITDEDAEKYVIQDNVLKYNPDKVTNQEEKWLIQLGIAAMTTLFTITFVAKGSTYQTIVSNKIEFPQIDPVSDEGNFSGWYYDQETTNKATLGDKIDANITLYAKWGDFVATFMVDGSKYAETTNNSLELPQTEPTKNNVKFTNWYYDEDCTQIANAGDILTKNTTLYSGWTSYITNKLEGKYICMLDYYEESSSDWIYANSLSELQKESLYWIMGSANYVPAYPAWVKLRNV